MASFGVESCFYLRDVAYGYIRVVHGPALSEAMALPATRIPAYMMVIFGCSISSMFLLPIQSTIRIVYTIIYGLLNDVLETWRNVMAQV